MSSKPCAVCGCFGTCHPNCPSGDVVHEPDPMSLRACAEQAIAWYQQFSEQPSMGYEPDYSKQLDHMITELAEENGFTYGQVMDEMNHIEYMADEGEVIQKTCFSCKTVHSIEVPSEDVQKWRQGALIQDAMPYLCADTRELLISSTCGTCFDRLFGGTPQRSGVS